MHPKLEVIQEEGDYLIVKYYANEVDTPNERGQFYGDIYYTKQDVLNDFPNTSVLEGYAFVEKKTGREPIDVPDWFGSVEEALEYLDDFIQDYV